MLYLWTLPILKICVTNAPKYQMLDFMKESSTALTIKSVQHLSLLEALHRHCIQVVDFISTNLFMLHGWLPKSVTVV